MYLDVIVSNYIELIMVGIFKFNKKTRLKKILLMKVYVHVVVRNCFQCAAAHCKLLGVSFDATVFSEI